MWPMSSDTIDRGLYPGGHQYAKGTGHPITEEEVEDSVATQVG